MNDDTMKKLRKGTKTSIRADVIVLGCSLPGLVTANKLKKKFGDSMDIVVLDLVSSQVQVQSKCNIAFQENLKTNSDSSHDSNSSTTNSEKLKDSKIKEQMHTSTREYLIQYGQDLRVPLPPSIISPLDQISPYKKIFQFRDGQFVPCTDQYNKFQFLNFLERFELNQYEKYLDLNMKMLFKSYMFNDVKERLRLRYYDQTSMEKNICDYLICSTSREIMRTTVTLVCGAPASTVSLLFYLHQCYRTCGSRHHVDGQNTRHREKLLGYCRKRIAIQLQQNIANITLPEKSIKNIRSYTDSDMDLVILETLGESTYICTILAMALRPEQLLKIEFDHRLLPEQVAQIIKGLTPGKAKKFLIQYNENFWESLGYSGDILSLRGPILWAMARPRLSYTGSVEKYAALIGYLRVEDDETIGSEAAVVQQLIKLFGQDAATPVSYRETSIADIIVPRCGDYIGLRVLTSDVGPKGVEWGAFDVFAEGDVAAALEAGHSAYLHLLKCLRPQAQTFEDSAVGDWLPLLDDFPITRLYAHVNVISTIKFTMFMTALVVGTKLLRSYLHQK